MPYTKQNFNDGDKLHAQHLSNMEDGIIEAAQVAESAAESAAASKHMVDLFSTISIEGYETRSSYNKTDMIPLAIKHPGEFIWYGWNSEISNFSLIVTASNSWDYYEMEVSPGEMFAIETVVAAMPFGCAFVDALGNVISKFPVELPAQLTAYSGQVTAPAGAVKMYVNTGTYNYLNPLSVYKLEFLEANFNFFRNQPGGADSDPLYNKKLAYVGDSITAAINPAGGYFKDYAEIVATRHGMRVYKDGIAGSTMANVEGQYPFCVDRYRNIPMDFDILTIWFGWNDSSLVSVGTINDTVDTTFYGAYNKVLTHLITTYPTKKIGLIVPYGPDTHADFQEAVRQLSKKYGCPCLDLMDSTKCSRIHGYGNEAQIARMNALLYDTVHPNQDGYVFLSSMYEEFIKSL